MFAFRVLKLYYESFLIKIIIDVLHYICEIALLLYMMVIPIEIAFFTFIKNSDKQIQNLIDTLVLISFGTHIFLYFDRKGAEIISQPYKKLSTIFCKLLTIQLGYDIITFFVAIYVVILDQGPVIARIIEAFFILKLYKLTILDQRVIYTVIGTSFYPLYKITFTLFVVFIAIFYVGSIFYGVAFIMYNLNGPNSDLIWIVDTPAMQNLVNQPFIFQIQYTIYWAFGTASTGAYGDISAAAPTEVVVNILALLFQGFLFRYYLNGMHSIPLEVKQQQSDLLQKFDAFEKHVHSIRTQLKSNNIKDTNIINNELYLKILCFLQYKQSRTSSLIELETFLPPKYLEEIKYQLYKQFLNTNKIIPINRKNLQFKLACKMKQVICQIGQNMYDFDHVFMDDLLYVKQGLVQVKFHNQLATIKNNNIYYEQQCFGYYQFITGLQFQIKAISLDYSQIYCINRQDYKQCLNIHQKIILMSKMNTFLSWIKVQPIKDILIQHYQRLKHNNSDIIFMNIQGKRIKIQSILNKQKNNIIKKRNQYQRNQFQSRKIIKTSISNTKDIATQTERIFFDITIDSVITQIFSKLFNQQQQQQQ